MDGLLNILAIEVDRGELDLFEGTAETRRQFLDIIFWI